MYILSNLALTVFEEVVALSITLINTNTYFNAIINYVSRYKRFNFYFHEAASVHWILVAVDIGRI